MLLLLLGIEQGGDETHKEEANLQGSGPSRRLVLFVIVLILCHVGAVVSSITMLCIWVVLLSINC